MSARKRVVSDESRMKKRKRQREWKAKRREEGIAYLGGKCVDCDETDPYLLEFDHVNPKTKAHEMTNIWSRKFSIRLAEINKCVLRCNQCHLKKTLRDRSLSPEDFGRIYGTTYESASGKGF